MKEWQNRFLEHCKFNREERKSLYAEPGMPAVNIQVMASGDSPLSPSNLEFHGDIPL
jgi:hypothetical protein